LEIGALSGVQIDALQFALDALVPSTALSEVEFEYHTPLLLLYCRICKNVYVAAINDFICPGCMGSDFDIKAGNELKIISIHGEKRLTDEIGSARIKNG
jgi:hydrogenase nickel incorporation protein HypA/HybF